MPIMEVSPQPGGASAPITAGVLSAIGASACCAGPLVLFGLALTEASTASLLLNLEAVLTAGLAWIVFRENVDRRIFAGMLAIVAGGVLLSWTQLPRAGGAAGPLLIAAAAVLGLLGYGVSLALFIVALRELGTARTGAYFSVAPFFGAALALILLGDQPATLFWIAGALMAFGVWLHLTERHVHEHAHEAMAHDHAHVHDEHHRHEHAFAWDGHEPHVHPHRHEPLAHSHPHYPDLHHRHMH